MCEACGDEERAIDAELTKVERSGQARGYMVWTEGLRGVWTADEPDWTMQALASGAVRLTHGGESIEVGDRDEALWMAELHRLIEARP